MPIVDCKGCPYYKVFRRYVFICCHPLFGKRAGIVGLHPEWCPLEVLTAYENPTKSK